MKAQGKDLFFFLLASGAGLQKELPRMGLPFIFWAISTRRGSRSGLSPCRTGLEAVSRVTPSPNVLWGFYISSEGVGYSEEMG